MMPNCKVIVTLWPDHLNLQPCPLAVQLGPRKFKPLNADIIWDDDDSVSVVMKLYFTLSGFTLTNPCIISTWTNGARSQSSLIVHLTLNIKRNWPKTQQWSYLREDLTWPLCRRTQHRSTFFDPSRCTSLRRAVELFLYHPDTLKWKKPQFNSS